MGSDGTHRYLKIILGVVLIAEVVISLSLANEGLSWKEEDEWDAVAASFKNGIRTFACNHRWAMCRIAAYAPNNIALLACETAASLCRVCNRVPGTTRFRQISTLS